MTSEQYLTATQAALQLGVSEKTVRRWIAEGKIAATHVAINRYAIERADMQRLAQERQGLAFSLEDISHQVILVMQRVAELASRIDALEAANVRKAAAPARAPGREIPASAALALPDGLVGWRAFATANGVPHSTVQKAIDSGRLPILSGEWKAGKTIVKGALDAAGRARFLELWPR